MAAETHHSKGKVPRQKRTPEGVPEDSAAVTEGERAGCQGVEGAWGYLQRDSRGERKRTLDCSPDCSAQNTKIVAHGSGLEEGPTLARERREPASRLRTKGSWVRGCPRELPTGGRQRNKKWTETGGELAASPASQTRACPERQPPSGNHPARLDHLAEGGETTRELSHELSCGSEGPSPPTQAEVKDPASAARELLRRAWPNAGPMEEDLAVETDSGPVRPAENGFLYARAREPMRACVACTQDEHAREPFEGLRRAHVTCESAGEDLTVHSPTPVQTSLAGTIDEHALLGGSQPVRGAATLRFSMRVGVKHDSRSKEISRTSASKKSALKK